MLLRDLLLHLYSAFFFSSPASIPHATSSALSLLLILSLLPCLYWFYCLTFPPVFTSAAATLVAVSSFAGRTRKCPNMIESALRLDVNKKLQLQDIACEAYLILNNKSTNQRRSVHPPFTIVGGPQKPFLKVYYHEPPSTILLNQELVAYCVACLGAYSTITWRIFNASDEPVTNENLLGSLTLKEKSFQGNLRIVFLYNIVSGANRPCVKILSFYNIPTIGTS
ncbi:hypothetical protein PoB_006695400 [Plakobranchus ocellatus]|uniref:Uncharacterized protein n=1 Tax=Plakobranchus ocellatus TaxID=259542 RepID=A0AAV4D896_9GAST|nr:hypothetical protein PoB_006695400 [Plakobranchus ocellatus]